MDEEARRGDSLSLNVPKRGAVWDFAVGDLVSVSGIVGVFPGVLCRGFCISERRRTSRI